MARPKSMKTTMMRVPVSFKEKTKKLSEKYKYPTCTEFIDKDVNTILDNADFLSNISLGGFFTRGKKKR